MNEFGLRNVKVFADGADLEHILALAERPYISGFTTNPTLMRKSGVDDYVGFARKVLDHVTEVPVCFEVFADGPAEMVRQGRLIASWGDNVFVKIPVTTTRRESTVEVIRELADSGVHVNVTAVMTTAQVRHVAPALAGGPASIVSVFAGRIADTGRDPVPVMAESLDAISADPNIQLLWASPREILNVWQADVIGVHIITVALDMIGKLHQHGRDLDDYSLETVQMFHDDARAASYLL